jgi:hypothetical protein
MHVVVLQICFSLSTSFAQGMKLLYTWSWVVSHPPESGPNMGCVHRMSTSLGSKDISNCLGNTCRDVDSMWGHESSIPSQCLGCVLITALPGTPP